MDMNGRCRSPCGWGAFVILVFSATVAFAALRPLQVLPLLRPAPPVPLRDTDSVPIALGRLNGVLVIFEFSALGCAAPCEDGHQALQQVQRRLPAASSAFLSVFTVVLDGQKRPQALQGASRGPRGRSSLVAGRDRGCGAATGGEDGDAGGAAAARRAGPRPRRSRPACGRGSRTRSDAWRGWPHHARGRCGCREIDAMSPRSVHLRGREPT